MHFLGSQGGNSSSQPISTPIVTTPLPVGTTTDPDDIIYNDPIKPVHEEHDEITDPYSNNKLPPSKSCFYILYYFCIHLYNK